MSTTDPIREILTALNSCVQTILGQEWSSIKYLEDLDKNNERTQNKVFGIRPLEAVEVEGVHKHVTLSQQFEVVLVRSKRSKLIGDSDYRELSYDNRRDILCIYKDVANNNLGTLALVVNGLTISEPEFIEDGKVVVQRATFNVIYRCKL